MRAAQALTLCGLRPLPGWAELPASCFGVIYRAAIYIASISAAVWGRCKEARGEGSSPPGARMQGARPLQQGMLSVVLVSAWLRVELGLAQGLVLLQHLGHPPCRKNCV